MRHGLVPYTDLWDRKPLGLFLIFFMAHAIGGESPAAYQLLALIACLVGALQVWWLGCRIADRTTAALGAAIYPPALALLASHSGQSEVFLLPITMAMAQALLVACDSDLARARRWCMLAMLLGGCALQLKYTVLVQCLFFGAGALLMLWRKGRSLLGLAGDALVFAGLGILPTALAAAWYAQRGLLDDFVFANFVSIGLRTPMPFGQEWANHLPLAIPLLALAGGGIVAAIRRPEPPRPEWKMALGWLGATALGLATISTIYFHNYSAAVPAAILVALPMLDPHRPVGLAAWAVFFLGICAGSVFLNQPLAAMGERQAISRIAASLSSHVGNRNHCLYVFDGPTALYQLTNSGLPSRFIYPDHLNNVLEERALPVDQVREVTRILAQRPGAIVTSADPVAPQNPATNALVRDELARHYRLVGEWNLRDRQLSGYARLPDADGQAPPCTLR